MATKTATKKTSSKALVPWTEKFAKYAKAAKEQTAKVVAGGVGVKFGHGTITVGGAQIPGGKFNCIVLGVCAFNAWYRGKYDPNNIEIPDCYAFAAEMGDEDMAPRPEAEDRQSETCATCEKNELGTAENGRGKACGNNLRVALITAKDAEDGESTAAAELATAKFSPTNVKHWKAYVDMLADDEGLPPWAVITEISAHHDDKTQIRLEFKLVEKIEDDDVLTELEKRAEPEKMQKLLQVAFTKPIAQTAKGKTAIGKSAKFAGKKAAKR